MTQPIRRRRATPAPSDTPAPAAPAIPRRRTVIPIAAAPTPQRRTPHPDAYVPPDDEEASAREGHQQDKIIVQRYMDRIKNPKTAIRARCVQCCNGQIKEVNLCPATGCALHPFRMGVNPFHKRTGTTKGGASTTEDDDNDE